MKVALVHDYLNQMGGAERVVSVFHKMFPDSPIYTTILDNEKLMSELRTAKIKVSWMQKIPGVLSKFKFFFWLYPFAINSIDLSEYDLIISSSSAYAKGIKKPSQAVHICYCHTPMRFVWDFDTYTEGMKLSNVTIQLIKLFNKVLKWWDINNSKRVDLFIANSTVVKKRILGSYSHDSKILYPPVDVKRFIQDSKPIVEDYFLVVSRLVSYKKVEIAIKAAIQSNKRLIVIGDGPDRERLESISNYLIEFKGRLPDQQVNKYMSCCKALIFPGVEDFGITPLEVNACGRPVIAFKAGGALDTIIPNLNGVFFNDQNENSLAIVMREFDTYSWNSDEIIQHANNFGEEIFVNKFSDIINELIQQKNLNNNLSVLKTTERVTT